MADSVVQGLSASASRIPSKWNRQTVADGSWLQKYTLNPLSARDVYLAEQIDKGTSALSAAISAEEARAISAETELQYQIDLMNAATDVINVFGTYSAFSSQSSWYFDPAHSASYHLTNNDIIKIINDEHTKIPIGDGSSASGHQTYFQWINNSGVSGDPTSPSDGTWNFIGFTDPYYNTVEIDEYFETLSGSISSNYYASGNISVVGNLTANYSTNKPPKIEIGIKDDVTFNSVTTNSATTTSLSSQLVTAINLSSNNISATNISATTLSASSAYGQSAIFDEISATHLTALTAQGNSAKFKNINADNLTSNNISSTNLTALTASGNQANYTNISATTLSGATTSINIDNLINAATAGAVAYSGKNGIQINDHDIMLSAKMSAFGNGITNNSAISLSSFKLSADTGIKFNATTDTLGTLGISVNSSIINSAESGAFASAYITANSGKFLNSAHSAYNKLTFKFGGTTKDYQANNSAYAFTFSAGKGINFITGNNQITITSNDTTYQDSKYISTADNIISVTDDLIGSAQSGKAAWNILCGTKISAVGTSLPNTGFGNLSAGFRISAGNNLTISTTANNTIQLNAKDTGITSISAKTGNSTALFSDHNVNLSAGTGVGFNFGNNLLTISAEGSTYHNGNYIEVDNTNKQINLSSNISATNISSDNIVLSKQTMGQGSYSANLSFSSMYMTRYGQPPSELLFDSVNVSAAGLDPGTHQGTVIASSTWYDLIKKSGGNYVSASGSQSITLATADATLVPNAMSDNIIYLV